MQVPWSGSQLELYLNRLWLEGMILWNHYYLSWLSKLAFYVKYQQGNYRYHMQSCNLWDLPIVVCKVIKESWNWRKHWRLVGVTNHCFSFRSSSWFQNSKSSAGGSPLHRRIPKGLQSKLDNWAMVTQERRGDPAFIPDWTGVTCPWVCKGILSLLALFEAEYQRAEFCTQFPLDVLLCDSAFVADLL